MYMNMRTPLFSLDRTSTHLRLHVGSLNFRDSTTHIQFEKRS